jgi:hypothetical protein
MVGGQIYRWGKLKYPEKITSGSEAVEVFYHYFTFIAVGDLIITM